MQAEVKSVQQYLADFLEITQRANDLGFDAVWEA